MTKKKKQNSELEGLGVAVAVAVADLESKSLQGKENSIEINEIMDIQQSGGYGKGGVIIDRDQEDADVDAYQKNGDIRLIEKVYINRIPTLKFWANKHYYPGLVSSVEDLFEELAIVFVKTVEHYDINRGSFNTCLFNFLLNRIKNIKNSKHAKKRISKEYDGPLCGMILSLDYEYHNDKEGASVTLKDIIKLPDSTDGACVLKDTFLDDTLKILAPSNDVFREFLVKISEGGSLASLIKEYKTKNGKINIDSLQAKKIGNRQCRKIVSDMIKESGKINGEFKLLSYKIDSPSSLSYEIEMKKTAETDRIMKTLRDLKRNKNLYISKIRGDHRS